MNRTRLLATLVLPLLVLGMAVPLLLAEEEPHTRGWEPQALWDEQLVALGYHLYRNSSVNVINGINLTREQAVKLRALAKDVEAGGVTVPRYSGRLSPQVQHICDTFTEIEKTLLAREEISDELQARLIEARSLESEILRSGLTVPVSGQKWGSCRRCHAAPRIADGRITYPSTDPSWETMGKRAQSATVKREMAIAHLGALLRDRKGFALITKMGTRIAEILTDNQKEVVREFSCCLVPPKSMTDALRVGQANVTEWQVELVVKARGCPQGWWPEVKERILDRLATAAIAFDPGMTAERLAEERTRIAGILEEARSLSVVDFELEKENLAAGIRASPTELREDLEDFNAAFFLLMPGSTEFYDRLIQHLDHEKALGTGDVGSCGG